MTAFKVCVFDAYGTLFDVNAAAREVAARPGHETFALVWQQVALDWRTKQLQYSWLRTLTGEITDFWTVTEEALDWALAASDQSDQEVRALLLGLYRNLKTYAEVSDVLTELRRMGLPLAILSNGSREMLATAIDSAGLEGAFDAVISVEEVGVFKPCPAVYDLVGGRFGCEPAQVLFASSNGWDVAGASSYGFGTVWVNRAGEPLERLPGQPARVAGDLRGVPTLAGEGL